MIEYKMEDILTKLKEKGYPTTRLRKEKIIAEGTLTKIRAGDTNISLKTVDIICSILDCKIQDIVQYVPEKK